MSEGDDFARRLTQAKQDWEKRHGRKLSNRQLGEAVAREMGRESFTSQTVGGWLRGSLPGGPGTVFAIARVLECDAAWLAGAGET